MSHSSRPSKNDRRNGHSPSARLIAAFNRLVHARAGVAALEFAFVAPGFVLLMLATADITFFVRLKLRLDTTARTVAQLVTQYNQLYAGDFTAIGQAAQLTAGSVSVSGTLGATIISGVTNPAGKPVIAWQQLTGGPSFSSQFGSVGASPQLPASYVPPLGGTVVVVELYTTASPWVFAAAIMGGAGTTVVQAVSLMQPRLVSLSSITPGVRS